MERNHAATVANHIGYLWELAWKQWEVSGGVSGGASTLLGLKGPTGIFELRDG